MTNFGVAQFHTTFLRFAFSLLIVCLATGIAASQTLPNISAGDQLGELPYVSFHGGDVDVVNLTSGTLSLHAPILSYPQRGNLHVSYSLQYNNMNQHYGPLCAAPDPCELDWALNTPAPIREKSDVFAVFDQGLGIWPSQPYPQTRKVGGQTYTDNYGDYFVASPDGAKHILGNLGTAGLVTWPTGGTNSYLVSSGPFESLDATGIRVNGTLAPVGNLWNPASPPIVTSDGVTHTTTSIQDANGNFITLSTSGIVDTIGRSVSFPPAQGSASNTSTSVCPSGPLTVTKAVAWTVPAENAGTATYTFCYVTVVPNMPFTMNLPQLVYGPIGPSTNLQSIVLPSGVSWKFEYDDQDATLIYNGQPVTYGTLSKITLPTGGSISYTWVNAGSSLAANNPNFCNNGGRWVASRTVTDLDGIARTWTYAYKVSFTGGYGTVVTDPLGNDTAHVFGLGGGGASGGCLAYETQTLHYQGSYSSGTLLRTVNTTYLSTANGNTFPNPTLNVVPSTITTIEENNQTTKTAKGYDLGFNYLDHFGVNGATGIYGKETSEQVYDYGPSAPGALLRTINTTYAWQNPNPNYTTYLSNNLLNLEYSVQIKDGGGTQRAYTYYGYDESGHLVSSGITKQKVSGETYAGNQTSAHRWLNGSTTATTNCSVSVSNGYLVANKYSYDTGEVQKVTDPCAYSTSFQYNTASPFYGAYLTAATNQLSQATNYGYDANAGLVTSIQDANLQTTTEQYDIMNRLTLVSFPDGGSTGACYTDMGGSTCTHSSAPPYEKVITKSITSSPTLNETSTLVVDGLGRLSQTQLNSDSPSTTYTLTTYDALGRKSQVYNPTRCSPITNNCGETTWGYTTTNYDPLGRVTSVVEQDGSSVSTSHTGNCTTVTDEAGKARKSCVDGLGRMTGVWEDPSGLDYETDYKYDVLSNLTNVTQNGSNSANPRPRSFVYDSLSHLTSAQNPESGTITYADDANGNVITKIAPLPNQTGSSTVTTTYNYDALNRLSGKSYSDGTPWESYGYDVPPAYMTDLKNIVGRLSFSANQFAGGYSGKATSTTYSYDAMGRVVRAWEQTPSVSPGGGFVYATYDLMGNLTSTTSPTNNAISYSYDAAARLTSVTGSLHDANHPSPLWSSDATQGYLPTGALQKAQFGNGLYETYAWEPRLQMCRFFLTTSGGIPGGCSGSQPSGIVLYYAYLFGTWGSTNNGNLTGWGSTVGVQNFNRFFTYDSLNRIQSMSEAASGQACKGLSWTVDAWGNMTQQTATGGTCYQFSAAALTNNQLTGYSYDAAGNTINDGSHSYTYDAENRISQVDGGTTATYIYNESGQRVRKATGSTWMEYFYAPDGKVLSEYYGTGYPKEYIYAGDRLIAQYNWLTGTTNFIHADHLGTTRLVTGVDQSVTDSLDFYPYGLQSSGDTTATHKFTGKERDSETGLDNFGARYDSSALGRFMTPDWAAKPTTVPYAKFGDPQSLNLYSYVENGPVNRIDPDGHDDAGGGGESASTGDTSGGSGDEGTNGGDQRLTAQNNNQAVGNTTVGALEKTMSNEDRSLSTPKKGDPDVLVDAKTALANAIINNAELDHPAKVAPATGTATSQDAQIMKDAATNRANGGADPVEGRTQYGTSHNADLKSRSASNGLKGEAGRETVYEKFGPFKDSTSQRPTYIYIYNDPGH